MRRLAFALVVLGLVLRPGAAFARAELTLDAPTLTQVLAALTPPQVPVRLPAGGQVMLQISDLKVTGFDPAAAGGIGELLASMRLQAPDFGIDVQLQPRVALTVQEKNGTRYAVARFQNVQIPMPLTGGRVDVASLIPVIPIQADHLFSIPGAGTDATLRSRLAGVTMGTTALRLEFDVTSAGPEATASRR